MLIADGPADRLHGGSGVDRAILPGVQGDYAFERAEGRNSSNGGRAGVSLDRDRGRWVSRAALPL